MRHLPIRSDACPTNQAGVPKAGWRFFQHLKALKLYYIMWLLQYTKKVSPRLPAPPPIHAGKPQHEGKYNPSFRI